MLFEATLKCCDGTKAMHQVRMASVALKPGWRPPSNDPLLIGSRKQRASPDSLGAVRQSPVRSTSSGDREHWKPTGSARNTAVLDAFAAMAGAKATMQHSCDRRTFRRLNGLNMMYDRPAQLILFERTAARFA